MPDETPSQPGSLVERLTKPPTAAYVSQGPAYLFKLCREAASRIAELERELERRDRVAAETWGDQADEFTPAIQAAHPTETKDFATFDLALKMIGKRHGKYELVDLANWLLSRAQSAEAAQSQPCGDGTQPILPPASEPSGKES